MRYRPYHRLAIEVHRATESGLPQAVCAACLSLELEQQGIQGQVPSPVVYKGTAVPLGFRADIVGDAVIPAIKAVSAFALEYQFHLPPYEPVPRRFADECPRPPSG
jgi:GxxExxY protein